MAEHFVRHGQTDWNLEHKIQGRVDIGLNSEGRAQAEAMRDQLASKQFDVIFSSPLRRAQETAEIIGEAHSGTPLVVASELTERNFGEYEGKHNNGDYYGLWQHDNTETPGGRLRKIWNLESFHFLIKFGANTKAKTCFLSLTEVSVSL